jgi:OOP family OmpA-OmpF porin
MPGKATAYLDQIAAQAKEDKDLKIIVEGHADETGTDDFNQFISMERAKTIGNYLVARGVSKDAIELKAMSDSQPIADNTTEEGRQLNRRVELTVE